MSITNLTLNFSGLAALAWMACAPAATVNMAVPSPPIVDVSPPRETNGGTHVPRADDGLFYVSGEVNGARIRFLVDTGASVTVLTRRDAERAGIPIGSARAAMRMRTASGSTSMHWIRLDHVRVAGSEMHGLDAAVMTNGPAVSLLGQNMLTKLASVTIDGNQLHLR